MKLLFSTESCWWPCWFDWWTLAHSFSSLWCVEDIGRTWYWIWEVPVGTKGSKSSSFSPAHFTPSFPSTRSRISFLYTRGAVLLSFTWLWWVSKIGKLSSLSSTLWDCSPCCPHKPRLLTAFCLLATPKFFWLSWGSSSPFLCKFFWRFVTFFCNFS